MKRDLKIDSNKVLLPVEKEALQLIQDSLDNHNIPFILVGAYTRDLLFSGVSSPGTIRKTMDFDTVTKIALECGRFGRNNCCQRF